MDDLDAIERRVERLRERLVSAVSFFASAAAAGMLVSVLRDYFVFVSVGAVGWMVIEVARLQMAAGDRELALDQLVLAGSSDLRCQRRHAELRSAQLHRRLARKLRQTCDQSHCSNPWTVWLVDRHAVHAVERDLRALATVFDDEAGHLPPAAVARVRLLLASSWSPLYEAHLDPTEEQHAIQTAQRIIASCRADLDD